MLDLVVLQPPDLGPRGKVGWGEGREGQYPVPIVVKIFVTEKQTFSTLVVLFFLLRKVLDFGGSVRNFKFS